MPSYLGSITSRCSGKEPALLPRILLGEGRGPDTRERRKSSLHLTLRRFSDWNKHLPASRVSRIAPVNLSKFWFRQSIVISHPALSSYISPNLCWTLFSLRNCLMWWISEEAHTLHLIAFFYIRERFKLPNTIIFTQESSRILEVITTRSLCTTLNCCSPILTLHRGSQISCDSTTFASLLHQGLRYLNTSWRLVSLAIWLL